MKKIILGASFLFLFFVHIFSQNGETWDINSLTSIGGHSVTVNGNPEVVSTDLGDAVEFDGDGDQLIVDANPIGTEKEFTIEMIFKPTGTYYEPRIIHIGELSGSGDRVMMEIRVDLLDEEWSLDGYLDTDLSELALLDEELGHPMNEWMHAAVTYADNTFKTYVNGVEELSGEVLFDNQVISEASKTSIGARMNYQHFFEGIIRKLKISYKALPPDEFITDEITSLHSSNIY